MVTFAKIKSIVKGVQKIKCPHCSAINKIENKNHFVCKVCGGKLREETLTEINPAGSYNTGSSQMPVKVPKNASSSGEKSSDKIKLGGKTELLINPTLQQSQNDIEGKEKKGGPKDEHKTKTVTEKVIDRCLQLNREKQDRINELHGKGSLDNIRTHHQDKVRDAYKNKKGDEVETKYSLGSVRRATNLKNKLAKRKKVNETTLPKYFSWKKNFKDIPLAKHQKIANYHMQKAAYYEQYPALSEKQKDLPRHHKALANRHNKLVLSNNSIGTVVNFKNTSNEEVVNEGIWKKIVSRYRLSQAKGDLVDMQSDFAKAGLKHSQVDKKLRRVKRKLGEETINEISKNKLRSYSEKALGQVVDKNTPDKIKQRRAAGYAHAIQKYAKAEEIEVNELMGNKKSQKVIEKSNSGKLVGHRKLFNALQRKSFEIWKKNEEKLNEVKTYVRSPWRQTLGTSSSQGKPPGIKPISNQSIRDKDRPKDNFEWEKALAAAKERLKFRRKRRGMGDSIGEARENWIRVKPGQRNPYGQGKGRIPASTSRGVNRGMATPFGSLNRISGRRTELRDTPAMFNVRKRNLGKTTDLKNWFFKKIGYKGRVKEDLDTDADRVKVKWARDKAYAKIVEKNKKIKDAVDAYRAEKMKRPGFKPYWKEDLDESNLVSVYAVDRPDKDFAGDRYEMHDHGTYHAIIKTHQGGESLKNKWGGYSALHIGEKKYVAKKWEQLKKDYNNPNRHSGFHFLKKEETINEYDILARAGAALVGHLVRKVFGQKKQGNVAGKMRGQQVAAPRTRTIAKTKAPWGHAPEAKVETPKTKSFNASQGPWGDRPRDTTPKIKQSSSDTPSTNSVLAPKVSTPKVKSTSTIKTKSVKAPKIAEPEKPSVNQSDTGGVKSSNTMSRADFLAMKKANPNLKVRAGNEESNMDNLATIRRVLDEATKRRYRSEFDPSHSASYHKRMVTRLHNDLDINGQDDDMEQRREMHIDAYYKKAGKNAPKIKLKWQNGETTTEEYIDEATHKKGGGAKGKAGAKGQETTGDDNPINMLRKAINLGGASIKHKSGEKTEVNPQIAHKVLRQYDNSPKPDHKESIIRRIWHSKQSFSDFLAGKAEEVPKKGISLGGSALVGGVGRRKL